MKTILLRLMCAWILFYVPLAVAQEYQNKSIRVIVTSAAGSGIDIASRMVAQHLSDAWKQPVVVDNRVGASGQIGGSIVSKAAPDGYTILVVSPVFLISPHLYANIPYDFIKDFAPIVRIGKTPYVMVVNPALAATSIAEFVALAKNRPGKINYGSNGSGTIMHLAGELLKSSAKIDIIHVPYKSSTQVVTDVVGNRVEMMFNSVTLLAPFIKDGKLRAIGMGSENRSLLFPNIPTFSESGFKDFDVTSWYGFVAPVQTPRPVLAKLQREISAFANSWPGKEKLMAMGTEPINETSEEFNAMIKDEMNRYGRVIKAAGVTVD